MSTLTADMYIKLKYMHIVYMCMGMRGVYRTCVVLHIIEPRYDELKNMLGNVIGALENAGGDGAKLAVGLILHIADVFRKVYDSSVTYKYEYVDDIEICFAPRDAYIANELIRFFRMIYRVKLGQVYIMMNV